MRAIGFGFILVFGLGILLTVLGDATNTSLMYVFGAYLAGFAVFLGLIFLRYWKWGKVIW